MPDALIHRLSAAEAMLDRASMEPRLVREMAVALLGEALAEQDLMSACFALQSIAVSSAILGDVDLLASHAEQALVLANRIGDGDLIAHALATRCAHWTLSGDATAMRADLELGLRLGRGHARARLLINSGALHRAEGRLLEAESAFRQALTFLPEGRPQRWALVNNLAVTLQGLGRLGEAAAMFATALELVPPTSPDVVAKVAMNMALLDLACGRVAEGLAAFDRADDQLRVAGLDPVPSLVDRCRILLDLGLVSEATDTAISLLRVVPGRRLDHIDVLSALVRALVLAGQWELAQGLIGSDVAHLLADHSAGLRDLRLLLAWLEGSPT